MQNQLKEHMDETHSNKESNSESENIEENLIRDNKSTINFTCENCYLTLEDKYKLEEHTKEKHEKTKPCEKTYKCNKCDFSSTSKHGLKIHEAKKHSVQDYYNSLYALSPRGQFPPRFPSKIPLQSHVVM